MSISIEIHGVVGVAAKANKSGKTAIWVDLKFADTTGKTQDITLFFRDEAYAERFAAAIQGLSPSAWPIEICRTCALPKASCLCEDAA